MENDNYKVQFEGVLCDETKNIVSHGFENCYSWREIMELVLDATKAANTDYLTDIEEAAEKAVRDWLVTFPGWGLLSSILDSKIHRHVVLSLDYTSTNWGRKTGGEFSEEKVFDTVKYVYENIPGKELHSLVPKFDIWFEEINEGSKKEERMKHFTLFFNAKWALEVKFVIEKKRINDNLIDLAAESVVKNLMIKEEIEELDIPETLFVVVREKFHDAEWVRSFWSAKQGKSNSVSPQKTFAHHNQDAGEEIPNENELEDSDEEQNVNEEFLASVVDELSSDVEDVLNGELGPDFLKDESASSNVSAPAVKKSNHGHGIDGLLLLWVFLFMLLAMFAYVYC